MRIGYLAFTDRGSALAEQLASALGGCAQRCGQPSSLADWTQQGFQQLDALVYVGACGIAVRAIAPHLTHKTVDPAVVVVDERGTFAISVLSGHIGGANELTLKIAAACGATPVITTATDVNGVFAVDSWATRMGCMVENPSAIKNVSGKLLAGQTVTCGSEWTVQGQPPQGVQLAQDDDGPVDFWLGVHRASNHDALALVPRIATLGIGCRKGIELETLEQRFEQFCSSTGIYPQCIARAASIDIKSGEPALAQFCANHGWPIAFYPAEQLAQAPGSFTPSEFVSSVTGVDNVCERSAVVDSGGQLVHRKFAGGGVTLALALAPFSPDWSR